MKSFPPEPDDESKRVTDGAVQEVLGELTERPARKPPASSGAQSEWPRKTGEIRRDVFRD